MYSRVIVPLDGSPLAELALDRVKELARDEGIREVFLVYVIQPLRLLSPEPLFDTFQFDAEDSLAEWAQEYLTGIGKGLTREGISASGTILRGNAADQILDYAAIKGADLIVMSTHGRTWPMRWIMGSVCNKVSRFAACPVSIIQPESNADNSRINGGVKVFSPKV
jgi:nucleotide-binding universal stress UspA family protein